MDLLDLIGKEVKCVSIIGDTIVYGVLRGVCKITLCYVIELSHESILVDFREHVHIPFSSCVLSHLVKCL